MLAIKNFLNKKYSKYLLLLLAFAFVISSVSGIVFMTNKYNIISVDNKKVGINEFIKMLNSKKEMDYYSTKNKEDISFLNSKEYMVNFLNSLLYDTVLYKSIYDYKLLPSNDVILKKIINEESFKTNGMFDLDKFNNMISIYNITQQNYIDLMKDQDSQNFLFSIFNNKIDINNMVDIIFNYSNLYKNVVVYKINKNKLNVIKKTFTEKELKEYYDTNIDDFKEEEKRKIDYIVLDKNIDRNKVEELLLTSFDMKELAKSLGYNIKSFGYLSNEDILKNEDIKDLTNYNINDLSNIKIKQDNYIIYSVVDIKGGVLKTFEESKEKISSILNEKYIDDECKRIIGSYIKESKNDRFFINNGFDVEDIKITNNYDKYGKDFTNNVLDSNTYSNVFVNDDYAFFAKIKDSGIINENDDDFIDKESIRYELESSFGNNIQNIYINYLSNYKYKVKVNYKLLDLIKNG